MPAVSCRPGHIGSVYAAVPVSAESQAVSEGGRQQRKGFGLPSLEPRVRRWTPACNHCVASVRFQDAKPHTDAAAMHIRTGRVPPWNGA
jgi:hypothetical protein